LLYTRIVLKEFDAEYADHVQTEDNYNDPANLGKNITQIKQQTPQGSRGNTQCDKNDAKPKYESQPVCKGGEAVVFRCSPPAHRPNNRYSRDKENAKEKPIRHESPQ
jgi:hypothetical protein